VYVPLLGTSSRVDLVYEDDTGVHRVQCKTSRLTDGALTFSTCSNTNKVRKGYRGQVELFGVYSPELGQVFLVPVDHVPARMATLRLDVARNGQRRRLRWARDYVVPSDGSRAGVLDGRM
jgi:hypothetical protein